MHYLAILSKLNTPGTFLKLFKALIARVLSLVEKSRASS